MSRIMGATEAIILAGGLGTRLKSAVPDLPKCMAIVAGTHFIDHVIHYLEKQGIRHYIFSLGYMSEIVIDHLERKHASLTKTYVVEAEPLGTGGAIRLAIQSASSAHPAVLNGDSIFNINLDQLYKFHVSNDALITCAIKEMRDYDRYGSVILNENCQIVEFAEKKAMQVGNINGGTYLIDKTRWMEGWDYDPKFSFEKDVLEVLTNEGMIYGMVQDGYFIDIGVPEDYLRASQELKTSL